MEKGPQPEAFTIYPETPVVQADLKLAQLKGGTPLTMSDFQQFNRSLERTRTGTKTIGGTKHKGSIETAYSLMVEKNIAPRNILEDVYFSIEKNHFTWRKDEIHYYAHYYKGTYIKPQDWWRTIQNEIMGERIDNYIKLLMYYPLVGWSFMPYYPYQFRWWWSKDKRSGSDWFPRPYWPLPYFDPKLYDPDFPAYSMEEAEQELKEFQAAEADLKGYNRYLSNDYPAMYLALRNTLFNEENKYRWITKYKNYEPTDFNDSIYSPLELYGAVVTKIERVIYKIILRELQRTWELTKPGFMDAQTIRLQLSGAVNDLYKGTDNILKTGYAGLIEDNARSSVPLEINGGYDTPRQIRLSLPDIPCINFHNNVWAPLDYIMQVQQTMQVNQALIGQLKLLASKYARVTDPTMHVTVEEEEALNDPERNMMLIIDIDESDRQNQAVFKDITENALQTGETPRKVVRPEYNQYVSYLKDIKSVLDYFEEDYSIADIPLSKYERDKFGTKKNGNILPWLVGGAAAAYIASEAL